jgi:hypothetical protein
MSIFLRKCSPSPSYSYYIKPERHNFVDNKSSGGWYTQTDYFRCKKKDPLSLGNFHKRPAFHSKEKNRCMFEPKKKKD